MTFRDPTCLRLGIGKNLLILCFFLIFIAMGIGYLSDPAPLESPDVAESRARTLLGLSLLSLGSLYLVYRIVFKRTALILHADGVLNKTGAMCSGAVPWHDILGFSIETIEHQTYVVVHLVDPQKYVARHPLPIRTALEYSMRNFHQFSPVMITTRFLGMSAPDVLALCEDYHRRYGDGGARLEVMHFPPKTA